MTREDIIRMADAVENKTTWWHGRLEHLERFAALVAAAEREACAKECDVQASFGNDDERFGARQCGYAIRSRGNT